MNKRSADSRSDLGQLILDALRKAARLSNDRSVVRSLASADVIATLRRRRSQVSTADKPQSPTLPVVRRGKGE